MDEKTDNLVEMTGDAEADAAAVEAKVDELAAEAGMLLHQKLPNADREPIELRVEHKVEVEERHYLEGTCGTCGAEIKTGHTGAIQAFDQGKSVNSHCQCGQRFTVPGRSRLVTPKDVGRVAVPGKVNNRHHRRTMAVVKGH